MIPVPGPSWLRDVPLAHRGLHAPGGPPENTLAAFAAARAAGFGVELDLNVKEKDSRRHRLELGT